MSAARRLAAALPKLRAKRPVSSSSAASPPTQTPTAASLLADLLSAPTPSASALTLLRDAPSLAAELYSLLAAPYHGFDPASLALLFSLPSCHRLPPPSPRILSALLYKILSRSPSSSADAARFLRDSLAAGAPPPDTSAFNTLLDALAQAGDLPGMTQLFASMRDASVRPNVVTYGILVKGLCKAGRVGDALSVLDGMSGPESDVCPDVVMLNNIVDGLCKTGRLQQAVKFVEERMRSVHGCAPNTVTYNCLAHAFCRAGNVGMACELVAKMEKERVTDRKSVV